MLVARVRSLEGFVWLLRTTGLSLQVARCTKIINPNTEDAKYIINVKQIAKVRTLSCLGQHVVQSSMLNMGLRAKKGSTLWRNVDL